MGQIVSTAAKPKRCNISQLSQLGTPAAGEYILVSSDNSMNATGQGNFDCYIVGNGTSDAGRLPLHRINSELVPIDGTSPLNWSLSTINKLVIDSSTGDITAGTSNYNNVCYTFVGKGATAHFSATKVNTNTSNFVIAQYSAVPSDGMSPIEGTEVVAKSITGAGDFSFDYYCKENGVVAIYGFGFISSNYFTGIQWTSEINFSTDNEQIKENRQNSTNAILLTPIEIINQKQIGLDGTLANAYSQAAAKVYVYDISEYIGNTILLTGMLSSGASTILWSEGSDINFTDSGAISRISLKKAVNSSSVRKVNDSIEVKDDSRYLAVNVRINSDFEASCHVFEPVSEWVRKNHDIGDVFYDIHPIHVYAERKLDLNTGKLVLAIGQAISVYVYDVTPFRGKKIRLVGEDTAVYSTPLFVASTNGTFDDNDSILKISIIGSQFTFGDYDIELYVDDTWSYIGIPAVEASISVKGTVDSVLAAHNDSIVELTAHANTADSSIEQLEQQVDSIGGLIGGNYDADIICWGNSLTVGNQDGSGVTYPSVLAEELGTSNVINAGVGGETTNEVAVRQGGNGFWIPAGSINGTHSYDVFKDAWGATVHMAKQTDIAGNSLNPINIDGKSAQLSLSGSTYTISEYTGGSTPVPLFAIGNGQRLIGKIVCIWVLANGILIGDTGVSGTGEMAQIIIDSMIRQIGHEHFIIVGYTGTKALVDSPAKYEYLDRYMLKYGDKFVHARWLLSQYGMDLVGMTPTSEDEEYIENYRIPPSLFYDNVHLNQYGYTALGKFIAQRCRALGYDKLLSE